MSAFSERTQVGRATIVAGLSRYAGRRLQTQPDDGMESSERVPAGTPSTICKLARVMRAKPKGLTKGEE